MKKILVVEDEEDLLQIYGTILREENYNVETVDNGGDALENVEKTANDLQGNPSEGRNGQPGALDAQNHAQCSRGMGLAGRKSGRKDQEEASWRRDEAEDTYKG